jgi:hypothetical protein
MNTFKKAMLSKTKSPLWIIVTKFSLLIILALIIWGNSKTLTANDLRSMAEQELLKHQVSVRVLEKTGHRLLLGEMTGAGLVPFEKVEYLVGNNIVISKEEILNAIPEEQRLYYLNKIQLIVTEKGLHKMPKFFGAVVAP